MRKTSSCFWGNYHNKAIWHANHAKCSELCTKLNYPDKHPSMSANTKCCWRAFPVGVCYSSIITCLQFVLGPKCGQRRKRRKSHTEKHISQQRDYGCSYSSSHCGSKPGGVFGGRRVSCRTKNGPDSSRDRCHVAADVQGTQMGTPGKLGGRCKRPRASHPNLRCECGSRTRCGTCSEQIQASSESTERGQHMAANPGEVES